MIGSSMIPGATWNRYKAQLQNGNHPNEKLQKGWNNLGSHQFAFEIIAELKQNPDDKTDLAREIETLEKMYLEEFRPYDDAGYHIQTIS